ncbi:hypothetical protein [Streptomyces sp. NRRL F-5755]|uniref:hypothetical protein n=1 Tax=Streptomyces sp. NRRL F-5755 TaxID=1519475 RepID=UPI0006B00A9D|nr:hypothetical protein [Streptomyces sp. NRRL F-5755]
MMTERGLVAPAAGRSILAHFDTILAAAVPEPAGRAQDVMFDVAPAAGTTSSSSRPAVNEPVSDANVRVLYVPAAER